MDPPDSSDGICCKGVHKEKWKIYTLTVILTHTHAYTYRERKRNSLF